MIVPRKKTLPIVVFMTVLFATIGLAFVLENVRPGLRVAVQDPEAQQLPRVQRSA